MLLPSIDLLPDVFSGMAPASCRPPGILISLKWELALPFQADENPRGPARSRGHT